MGPSHWVLAADLVSAPSKAATAASTATVRPLRNFSGTKSQVGGVGFLTQDPETVAGMATGLPAVSLWGQSQVYCWYT
jgi:hypothetical protein